MTAIGIIGSKGRMGLALVDAISAAGVTHAGGVDHDSPRDALAALAQQSGALIDFSAPGALEATLDAAMEANTPVVVGTTGLAERHHWLIDSASAYVPVLQTGNTSLGITLLTALVRQAAERLGDDWDIEIVETHHRHKVDAPSGTALMLGEAAANGRNVTLDDVAERGRDGITGPRKPGTIGFASLRGGGVTGEHDVLFAAEHERLVLRHISEDLSLFASGAVKAVLWLTEREPGRYSMEDMLGLGSLEQMPL